MAKADIKEKLNSSELLLKKKENELECLQNYIKQIKEDIQQYKIQLCKFKVGEIVKVKHGSDLYTVRAIVASWDTTGDTLIMLYKDSPTGIQNTAAREEQLQKINVQ